MLARLAAQMGLEGVYFKNAFVTTPICAASRASILTGMYERTHGYTFGQGQIKRPYLDHSYPKMIRDSGYYTGFFGKFGVSYGSTVVLFDVMTIMTGTVNSRIEWDIFIKPSRRIPSI